MKNLDSETVTLTLAFEPDFDFVRKLNEYFSQNMGHRVTLDLKVDKKIVGGAIVIANNHWRDYSVAAVVENNMKNQI